MFCHVIGHIRSSHMQLHQQCSMFIFARVEDKQPTHWTAPPDGTVKINADASYLPSTGDATIGALARDHNGSIIAVLSQTASFCQDAEEAEGWASLAGLQLGIDLEFHLTTLESDCAIAVRTSSEMALSLV